MKFYKKALGVGALVCALVGCGNLNDPVETKVKEVEIKLLPLGVSKGDYGTGISGINISGLSNGKPFIAYNNTYSNKGAQIEAAVEHEIGDGDKEEIILRGTYVFDKFRQKMLNFNYIEVNGYKFKLP